MNDLEVNLDEIFETIKNDKEVNLKRLQRYISQPSISAENNGNYEMCELLVDEIINIGGSAEINAGVDFPLVFGKMDNGSNKTILIHSMYDTTPHHEEGWLVDPLEGTCLDYLNFGKCILGRGVKDTKGPISAVFSMINSYKKSNNKLPMNFLFIFEASEMSSGSLPNFVQSEKESLKKADLVYWPWFTERPNGTGVVWLGCKGLMNIKLRCIAGDWGGPANGEVHSFSSALISNPAQELSLAIASLKNKNDTEININNFHIRDRDSFEMDNQLIEKLLERLDPKAMLDECGSLAFKHNSFEEALKSHVLKPEINVSGISSGYADITSHKAIIPSEAIANLDIRLVDKMTPKQVIDSIRVHLDKNDLNHVEIIWSEGGYSGGKTHVNNWAAKELINTYKEMDMNPEIWPRTATSIAVNLFTEDLNLPWIGTSPGIAGNHHAANEFLNLDSYNKSIMFMSRLIYNLGKSINESRS